VSFLSLLAGSLANAFDRRIMRLRIYVYRQPPRPWRAGQPQPAGRNCLRDDGGANARTLEEAIGILPKTDRCLESEESANLH
jgi:hypothetical protein